MRAIETCYISTGFNRTPHCADWGCSGLICFGAYREGKACHSVSIYQPEVWFYPAIPGLFSLKFIYSRSYSLCCLLLHQRVRQERQISTKLCPSLCHYFFLLNKYNLLHCTVSCLLVRDSSVVRRHYISLLEPSNVRAQYIRKTADLPHRLSDFYFLSETLI